MPTKWEPSPVPSAPVTPVDTAEVDEPDGRKSMVFQTRTGVRFVRITEPSGYVYWIQEVKG
jgi:hypothetical protein